MYLRVVPPIEDAEPDALRIVLDIALKVVEAAGHGEEGAPGAGIGAVAYIYKWGRDAWGR